MSGKSRVRLVHRGLKVPKVRKARSAKLDHKARRVCRAVAVHRACKALREPKELREPKASAFREFKAVKARPVPKGRKEPKDRKVSVYKDRKGLAVQSAPKDIKAVKGR